MIYQENYVKQNKDRIEERLEGTMATVFLSLLYIFQILYDKYKELQATVFSHERIRGKFILEVKKLCKYQFNT